MGNVALSTGLDRWRRPEYAPNVTKPPVFDPLEGFPNGRKKREMKATWEEMEKYNVEIFNRDYCAHTFIAHRKCVLANYPVQTTYNCLHEKHAMELCQWEDQIMRMKEYERERRLLEREHKLKQKEKLESAEAA